MRILTVVGNRPQFIKAAAVSGLLREAHEEILVHTGQHHDDNLSAVFFEELGLARPDRMLGIAGGSNTSQTARMLAALEPLLAEISPDAVLVYGDTNSTLAGALAAAQAGVGVIHVEAGMRSYDRSMPEELNRVLADHIADLLLCPSQSAADNLAAESVGIASPSPDAGSPLSPDANQPSSDADPPSPDDANPPSPAARRAGAEAGARTVEVVGDVMVDVALRWQPAARANRKVLKAFGVEGHAYLLLSAHRAGNVDQPERLAALVELIEKLPCPVVFPVHPRTVARLKQFDLRSRLAALGHVRLADPLPYAELSALVCQARAVLTDSGGIQKEAYLAGVRCLTLRSTTEWTETVETGWNTLVDLDIDAALAALDAPPPAERPPLYGAGDAAARCVEAITAWEKRRRAAAISAG